MTLGRTASNAIKIKVEDGTTRAVNCACCVSCGCNTSPISELLDPPDQLIEILDTATTATCNGQPPTSWNVISLPSSPGWYATWFYFNIYTARWYSDTKCLDIVGDNALNLLYSGTCSECSAPWAMSCVDQQYTINGTPFPCHTDIIDDFFPDIVPPPAFVF